VSGSKKRGALSRLVCEPGSRGAALRVIVLTLIVLVAYPMAAAVASAAGFSSAWASAALAASVCWLGAVLALVLSWSLRGPHGALYAMLLGFMLRMGLPLAAIIVAVRLSPGFRETGFVGLVFGFYLLTLVAETLLALAQVPDKPAAAKVP
jgi:hypothetical protein